MSDQKNEMEGVFVYIGGGGAAPGCRISGSGGSVAGSVAVTTKGYPAMSDKLLASMRRLAKVAKRDGRRYETEMIIGYGRGADMGKGFSVFTPDELDAHIALVSGLKTSYDELAAANDALHDRVAQLEKRLEIDHVFVGPDMVREEVPPEKRPDMVDGITARDSTIAIIRQNNEKLRARVAELELAEAELSALDAKYSDLSTENAKLRYMIKHGIGSGGDGGAAGEPGKPGR